MNNIEYAEKAKRTLPDLTFKENSEGVFERVASDEIGVKLNLVHMALGLSGEIGELVQCVGTELKSKVDLPNLKEELGDLYWYLVNYCTLRDINPPKDVINNDLPQEECFELLIISVSDIVDITKKLLAYNKEIDRTNELEYIYNIYNGLDMFQKLYDLDGAEIRTKNIEKLQKRYPDRYSDFHAVNRNTDEERKTLEA